MLFSPLQTRGLMDPTADAKAQDAPIEADPPTDNEDEVLSRPVVVVTNAMSREPLPPRPGVKITRSPLGDVSVVGYPDDGQPKNDGLGEITSIVKMLESAGIQCCMVEEPALIYYGTGRIMFDWMICVPTEQLEKATELLHTQDEIIERFGPSAMTRPGDLSHLHPRFKFKGVALFLILMTSQACHLSCAPHNFEYSDNGIPYPQLHVFAQSLLDTHNAVDLQDLIDGMNLLPEWGEENLDLEGMIDVDWLLWSQTSRLGGELIESEMSGLCKNPPKRRDIWLKWTSDEAKKRRQGIKYKPGMLTRWRREGHKDPRIRTRKCR